MNQALYRTWRPTRFADVVEQSAVVTTLRRQVQSGRPAHAYLFCGSRGTGKTTIARLLARAVNCRTPQDGEACGACASCTALALENMDIVEIDAASNNGVDEIRDLRDKVKYPPQHGRYKVYIIDEVHMLSTGAFNALLKTLEEPPPHALFILATTEPQRLPATVLSRCQRFDFQRISLAGIAGRLRLMVSSMGMEAEDEALRLIARSAEGGMRDAQTLLEVCIGYAEGALTAQGVLQVLGASGQAFLAQVVDALLAGDTAGCLQLVERLVQEGRDAAVFLRDLTGYMRQIVVAVAVPDCRDLLALTAEEAAALRKQALAVGPERALYWLEMMARAEGTLRWASQPRLLVEVCMVRACRPDTSERREALEARVKRLEEALERGAASQPAKPAAKSQAVPAAAQAPKEKAAAHPSPKPPAANDAPGLWAGVLAAVKSEFGMSKYVLLQKGKPRLLDAAALTVWFSAADSVFYRSAVKEENQQMADALTERIAGRPLHVRFELEGQSGPVDNTPFNANAAPDPAARPSLAQQAIALFGADNVTILDEDEP